MLALSKGTATEDKEGLLTGDTLLLSRELSSNCTKPLSPSRSPLSSRLVPLSLTLDPQCLPRHHNAVLHLHRYLPSSGLTYAPSSSPPLLWPLLQAFRTFGNTLRSLASPSAVP